MNIKYFSLAFSTTGVIILYLLSLISQPPLIQTQNISQYEGRQVILEGIVVDYSATQHGSQIIKIKENLTTEENKKPIILFLSGNKTVHYGDKLSATGTVQRYNDDWELLVDNPNEIEVIEEWGKRAFPLWQVAQNPERYCNINVNVTGKAQSVYSTYFYLSDTQKDCEVVVRTKPRLVNNISSADRVSVAGKFCYDDNTLQYYINVAENNHGVWGLGE